MPDDIVTWRLHKKGVILLIAGCVLVSMLTFAGGYILGASRAKRTSGPPPKPAVQKNKAAVTPAPRQEQLEPLALRIGLFTVQDDAKALVAQLAAVKVEAKIVPMETSSGVTLFSVESGHYTNRRDALAASSALRHEHAVTSTVVPAGQAVLTTAPAQ